MTERVSSVVYLNSDDVSHSSDVELTPTISTKLQRLGFVKHLVLDSFIDEEGQLTRTRAFRFYKRVTSKDLLETISKIANELPQLVDEEQVDYVRDILDGEGESDIDVDEIRALQIEFRDDNSQEEGGKESDGNDVGGDSTASREGRKKRILPAIILIGLLLYSQDAH